MHQVTFDGKVAEHAIADVRDGNGVITWVEHKEEDPTDLDQNKKPKKKKNPRLLAARNKIQEELKPGNNRPGIFLGWPDCNSQGGNTTTAAVGRKFYRTKEIRDRMINLVPEEFRPRFKEFVENNRIVMAIMASSRKVKVDKLKDLCNRQLDIIQSFNEDKLEVKLPPTIHETFIHLPEKIKANDSRGLSNFSEENLESVHKIARRFRTELSRKTSKKATHYDTLRRLNVRSSPLLVNYHQKVNRCSNCKEVGHIKSSCEYDPKDEVDARLLTYFEEEDLEEDVTDEPDEVDSDGNETGEEESVIDDAEEEYDVGEESETELYMRTLEEQNNVLDSEESDSGF